MNDSHLRSISQLSELTGRSRQTVTLRLKGVPVTPGAKGSHLYDTPIALEAIYKPEMSVEELDLVEERTRLTKLQADKAQLELDKARGEVVAISMVTEAVGLEYTRVRARLLSIPSKLAKTLSIETEPAVVREELDREIFEALSELTADESPIS